MNTGPGTAVIREASPPSCMAAQESYWIIAPPQVRRPESASETSVTEVEFSPPIPKDPVIASSSSPSPSRSGMPARACAGDSKATFRTSAPSWTTAIPIFGQQRGQELIR